MKNLGRYQEIDKIVGSGVSERKACSNASERVRYRLWVKAGRPIEDRPRLKPRQKLSHALNLLSSNPSLSQDLTETTELKKVDIEELNELILSLAYANAPTDKAWANIAKDLLLKSHPMYREKVQSGVKLEDIQNLWKKMNHVPQISKVS